MFVAAADHSMLPGPSRALHPADHSRLRIVTVEDRTQHHPPHRATDALCTECDLQQPDGLRCSGGGEGPGVLWQHHSTSAHDKHLRHCRG